MRRTLSLLALLLVAWHGTASAAIIWDQSNRTGSHTQINNAIVADDFVLKESTTLDSFRIWIATGGHSGNTLPNFSGTIGWGIYTNAGTAPGTLLASGQATSPTLTATNDVNFFTRAFQLDADFQGVTSGSVSNLAAGTYWLAIHEGNWGSGDDGSSVSWLTSTSNNGSTNRISSNLTSPAYTGTNGLDMAFQLFDSPANGAVPEPATMTIWGLGALGCAAAAYRRRKRVA